MTPERPSARIADRLIELCGELRAEGLAVGTSEVLDAARTLAPGADVYALEAEWRAFWVSSGRPRLTAPDRAFLAWVKGRVKRR